MGDFETLFRPKEQNFDDIFISKKRDENLSSRSNATGYRYTFRDPQGRWKPERSALVVGIPRADAEGVGRAFGQNAIVFVERGRAPELLLLGE